MAALVSRITADEVDLTLVNVNQLAERTVVVQGGTYGEHTIMAVADVAGHTSPVAGRSLRIKPAPGAGAS